MIVKPLYYIYLAILTAIVYILNPLLVFDLLFMPEDEKEFKNYTRKIKANYLLYFLWVILCTGSLLILSLSFNSTIVKGFYQSINEHPFLLQWTERKPKK